MYIYIYSVYIYIISVYNCIYIYIYIHAKIKYFKNNKIDTVSFGTFEGWPWATGIRP